MFKYSKIALGLATCFALTGCLEVEDDGNKEISNQLNEQNQLLQSQVDLLQEQQDNAKAPAAIRGTVVSVSEGVSAADAQVSIFWDNAWSDAVAVTEDGSFNFTGLPAGRNIIVKVSSESDVFMTRYFKVRTGGSVANGVHTTDLFELEVSEGYTKEISILDSETNQPIKNLTIWADDVFGLQNRNWNRNTYDRKAEINYSSKATFNEEKGVYEIQVAKDLPANIYYKSDLNGDGNDNYVPESTNYLANNGEIMLADASAIESMDVMYLVAANHHEFTIALTVLDEEGNTLEVKRVYAEGNDFGEKYASFNEETKQYDLEAHFVGSLEIVIPGFEKDELVYGSENIHISYDLALSAFEVYSNYRNSSVELSNNTLNLVVKLQTEELSETTVRTITTVEAKDTVDNDVQLYLNVPVEVNTDNVKAVAVNHVVESKDGWTTLQTVETDVEHDVKLDLDNTRITVAPKKEVVANHRYRVSIGEVTNTISGKNEQLNFYGEYSLPAANAVFDINELTADNFNYHTNGTLIVKKNSAGEDSWAWDYDGHVTFILPKNLHLVEKFSYSVVKYTKNNTETTADANNMREVINGDYHDYSTAYLAKIAQNENHHGEVRGGSAQENGYRARIWNNYDLRMNDNKTGSKNTVTINYSYQLKGSEDVITGTLELPIQ
ncbi:carboxypeptidase-like regulatory domain-containing protein [Pseudoalteromonas luteoviolacea]|uniref:Uncharacterized protein n=1 Tax=Pseudoalteromonas luteoviolacea H33 TaxID=1365251 RepID=A0A167B5Y3_9GAMM|nr:carboxypeptidase-like regulatory domain-containing protein [Pseudoalteromonas luteoviolacea]KZN46182.1 hypothetical protein N476_03405 [Pseudoalteromonas luteoviolacea H33]KZN75163.1 hypothetical protein N477_19990 [Pseudoalteromonas luteoviolacea H33-S]